MLDAVVLARSDSFALQVVLKLRESGQSLHIFWSYSTVQSPSFVTVGKKLIQSAHLKICIRKLALCLFFECSFLRDSAYDRLLVFVAVDEIRCAFLKFVYIVAHLSHVV